MPAKKTVSPTNADPFHLLFQNHPLPMWTRLALALLAFAAYALVFVPLHTLFHPSATVLSILPVLVPAWLWGVRGGLLAALLTFPLNILLSNLAGEPGWDVLLYGGYWPGNLIVVAAGATVGWLSDMRQTLLRQIAVRTQAEARIRKLNRTLTMFSDINQAIVRVRQPQALFARACHIAVEQGGFRMAWIGLADATTRKVEVVAHAGVSDGYLEKLVIVLSDEARGRASTAAALSAGRHVIANDIAQDPRMAAWREDALRLGYCAAAAFPLQVNGQTRATFNLYASEVDFFGAEEIKLLDELALDLSFALEFSETDEDRKQAEDALRASEEHYRAVAYSANDAIISADSTGNIMGWNPGAERIFGYTESEVRGQPLTLLIPARYHEGHLAGMARLRSGGEPHIIGKIVEVHGLRKEGGEVPLELSLAKWESAESRFYTATIRDITERKQAEESLRKKDEHYRNVVENIFRFVPEGLLVFTENLNLVKQNHAFEEIVQQYAVRLGYSEQELADLIAEQARRKILSGDTTEIHIPKKAQ